MASAPEDTLGTQDDNQPQDNHFYSTFVMEYIVPDGQDAELLFRRWYDRLVAAAQTFVGHTRTDLCPPLCCDDGVVKWYSIVHFRTPTDLKCWLSSDQRADLLEQGRDTFLAYRYKSFTTGLEGWFSTQVTGNERHSLGPPPWKQVLAVVLGLYPTIMLQGMVFRALGLMQSWPMATALVINNLVTSSILTWVVMPRISRLLSFWLRPAYRLTDLKTNLIGAGLIVVALGFMTSLFTYFS